MVRRGDKLTESATRDRRRGVRGVEKFDLVACDLDGTLFPEEEVLTNFHYELRDYIARKRIPFTFVSGRSWPGLKPPMEFFNVTMPVVGNNGGVIYFDQAIVWSKSYPAMSVRDAILEADKLKMAIIFTVDMEEYAYRHVPFIKKRVEAYQRYGNEWRPSLQEWQTLRMDKLLIIDPNQPGKIDQVLAKLTRQDREKLNVVRYNSSAVDITAKGTDKARGLHRLKGFLQAKQVVAFGDGLNDISFLQEADLGIAMVNADARLQAVADHVTGQIGPAGILAELRELVSRDMIRLG